MPLAPVSVMPPESFSICDDARMIIRHVRLRTGKVAESRFALAAVPRKNGLGQLDLAALADASFLRARNWPATTLGAPTVRIADLFSGCGIMSLGVWEAARALGKRMDPVLALDVNRAAIDIYERNFPRSSTSTDPIEHMLDGEIGQPVTRAEKSFLAGLTTVDMLIGGPPCQGHSNLNNHTRRNDPKNRLYERMARFAELVGPRHIVIENVPAALHDHGRVVARTIATLVRLGYKVDHGVAEVSALGAAQKRRRHVVMASLDRSPDQERTLSHFTRGPRTVEWAIGDLTAAEASDEFDCPGRSSRANAKRIEWLFKNQQYDLPDRLRPDCHKLKEHSYKSVYGRLYWDRPSQTITSGFTSMGQGRYVHPDEPRTITPHEAARLQFIPDFFSFRGTARRTALTEMIGNAVPAKLTYVLALELLR